MLSNSTLRISCWTTKWGTTPCHMLEKVMKEKIRVQSNIRCLMKRMAGILSQNQTVFGTIKFEKSKLKTIQ